MQFASFEGLIFNVYCLILQYFSCYWFLQNCSRSPPVASKPLGYGQRHNATVDIPLYTTNVMSLLIQRLSLKIVRLFLDGLILFSMIFYRTRRKKGQELAAWEADLKWREKVDFIYN